MIVCELPTNQVYYPRWIPGWKFGIKLKWKAKISSKLSKTLESMKHENTIIIRQWITENPNSPQALCLPARYLNTSCL